jgi:pimeloyl-ACP methyl ester carboxylesterase
MGGGVAVRAASRLGTRLHALVVVDSALGPPPRPAFQRVEREQPDVPEHVVFRSFEEARARFKLRPGSTVATPELLEHLARHALLQLPDGGFTWRFDPRTRQSPRGMSGPPDASAIRCPVISIWGAHSPMLARVDPRDVGERFPSARFTTAEIIPDAHHHVFLDQPDAFNAVLLRHLASIGD